MEQAGLTPQALFGLFSERTGRAAPRKVAFFRGASLRPLPPGVSKHKDVRYLDIYEDQLDEGQFVAWVTQASQLPGERM